MSPPVDALIRLVMYRFTKVLRMKYGVTQEEFGNKSTIRKPYSAGLYLVLKDFFD